MMPPDAAPAFSVERTTALVCEVLKRGRLKPPTTDAIAQMAHDLSIMAAQARTAPTAPDELMATLYEREPMHRARSLRRDLTRLIEARRCMGASLGAGMASLADANAADIAAMERLCRALDDAAPAMEALPKPSPWRGDEWSGVAFGLACIFRVAMRSTNAADLGMSDNGPVVRFVRRAIIELFGGNNVEFSAIAKNLKRAQAEADRQRAVADANLTRAHSDQTWTKPLS